MEHRNAAPGRRRPVTRLVLLALCAVTALWAPTGRAVAADAVVLLEPVPSPVAYGTSVVLRAAVSTESTSRVLSFYRRGGNGAVSLVGQAPVDPGGSASVTTTATGNAEFWATDGTATSEVRAQAVTRSVAIEAVKKSRGRYLFVCTASVGGGRLVLQVKDKDSGWVTAKTGAAVAGAVGWTLKPRRGTTFWRALLPATGDFLQAASAEVKVRPKKRDR